jgi:hypothetical protein
MKAWKSQKYEIGNICIAFFLSPMLYFDCNKKTYKWSIGQWVSKTPLLALQIIYS